MPLFYHFLEKVTPVFLDMRPWSEILQLGDRLLQLRVPVGIGGRERRNAQGRNRRTTQFQEVTAGQLATLITVLIYRFHSATVHVIKHRA